MAKKKSTKSCCADCDYNLLNQTQKKLKFLWRVNDYIKDARKARHSGCVKLLQQIKKDETKHVEAMKKLLHNKHKKGPL